MSGLQRGRDAIQYIPTKVKLWQSAHSRAELQDCSANCVQSWLAPMHDLHNSLNESGAKTTQTARANRYRQVQFIPKSPPAFFSVEKGKLPFWANSDKSSPLHPNGQQICRCTIKISLSRNAGEEGTGRNFGKCHLKASFFLFLPQQLTVCGPMHGIYCKQMICFKRIQV